MPDTGGIFGDVFEQGGQIARQVGKQIAGIPSSTVKTAANQVAPTLAKQAPVSGEENAEDSPDNKKNQQQHKSITPPKTNSQILRGQFIKPKPEQVAAEQAELAKVRQELHHDYYKDLTDRPKQQEEKVADKIEREEKEEEQKKFIVAQKDQEKNSALTNVRQGTGEKLTGIGG